ncbi:hypothetical protein PR202_ga12862 [Eleusine coracana subsp. coracana]|uniref:HTH myb-type domain-containing protein n=1 Tax=Eleusine coracana subsp. coracana TaxID=191504 RepID=A0AAV5CCJ4_ELECO|nr:hypothetical protein PR202_ga12862 [Eleusine coracana subsp. coracana]
MMRNQPRGGHIFNIDGAGSDGRPTPRFAAYGATKRSVVHLTKSLQAELQMNEVNNVMVHNLSPGMVTTDLLMSGATTKQVTILLLFPYHFEKLLLCLPFHQIFGYSDESDDRYDDTNVLGIMLNNKPGQYNDASDIARIILAMQPTRKRWWWPDDLHKIFVKAVAYHGAAKPSALQQTMEAMGVRGLTTCNIKSHLQKYRSKYDSEAGAHDVPGTTSPGKAVLNLISDMIMDTDAVKMEIKMVECNFSADELQTMEKELMSEIQLIEVNAESTETMID